MLAAGGHMIVTSAVDLAHMAGISERVIGLTIVSIGTSLPELATSAVAALRKNVDIAIGNIVGSNIFNIFFILGLSSILHPLPIQPKSETDILVNIAAEALLFIFIFTGKGRRIERPEGIFFISSYLLYLAYLFIR